MVRIGFKMQLIIFLLCFFTKGQSQEDKRYYCAINTCDFTLGNTINGLRELTILRYRIVNNVNKDKKFLCQYFLVTDGKDTFNVISIFNEISSDTFIKENRFSKNWVFKKISTDSCFNFYSQFNLSKQIEKKHQVLLGSLYGELD